MDTILLFVLSLKSVVVLCLKSVVIDLKSVVVFYLKSVVIDSCNLSFIFR